MRERTITVDINKNYHKSLNYKQYDNNNVLNIVIKEDDNLVDITDYTARAFYQLPSKTIIQRNTTKNGKNTIKLKIDNVVLAESGRIFLEVVINNVDTVVTTFTLFIDVEKSIDRNEAIEGYPEWDIIADGLSHLDDVENRMSIAENEIVDIESEVSTVKNRVSTVEGEVADIKNEVTDARNGETSLKTRLNRDIQNTEEKLNTAKNEINTTKNELNTTKNEIIEARNGETTLKVRLDKDIQQTEEKINIVKNEIIDARDGETSLKVRLDRDIEKAKQVYVNVEGSNISTDSSVGYAKDVEILGNTIQDASNLADIRSVGDKVEGQELYEIPVLSRGKNLWNGVLIDGDIKNDSGSASQDSGHAIPSDYVGCPSNTNIVISYTKVASSSWFVVYEYDKDKNYLGYVENHKLTTKPSTRYIKFKIQNTPNIAIKDLMIEVGTQATPYEPYQEDKITILSPTPLEKVGDVADRIICKDGVWGVEKKFLKEKLNDIEVVIYGAIGNGKGVLFKVKNILYNWTHTNYIIEGFKTVKLNTDATSYTTYCTSDSIAICLPSDFDSQQKCVDYLKDKTLIAEMINPTFIPLPHDQQVKLRTFANKTNISFLTEIEGTIKAQVPKSLGATVNTHTEQINNLNKELDRVKKLEESTVSTVTTESDFTTVEATSNGYFEDVKLEGKTLVNLSNSVNVTRSYNQTIPYETISNIQIGKLYTLIVKVDKNTCDSPLRFSSFEFCGGTNGVQLKDAVSGDYVFCPANTTGVFSLKVGVEAYGENGKGTRLVVFNNEATVGEYTVSCLLLEGDHTQNPPEYFEGLMSVGEDVEEVSVESCGKNLIDNTDIYDSMYVSGSSVTGVENSYKVAKFNISKKIKTFTLTVKPKDEGVNFVGGQVLVGVEDKIDSYNYMLIKDVTTSMTKTFENKNGYMLIGYYDVDDLEFKNKIKQLDIQLENNVIATEYSEYIGDKKPLLYFNPTTETWEKPILHEWDSIEKHADGKYYYHKRSGEVVLNGGENWYPQTQLEGFTRFGTPDYKTSGVAFSIMSDKFATGHIGAIDYEAISLGADGAIHINILSSKLSTQDVQGFKQWLQANNVTVVYQLEEEKVYECTNIDLITYANETNYVVESGAIVPRTTLKVMSNISNTVRELQRKVSTLESYIQYVMIDALNNALNE